jgi:glycerol-3-phosphate dehydrogenase
MTSPTPDSTLKTPDSYDVIIVGAGINGAGIARDAAMRGLKVLLLDKGDISNGTTAASTRLIHGGLRYLEHFEIGLVRESLREREVLLHIAPHLVKPIPLLIPIYRGGQRSRLRVKAGMITYDLLSMDKSLRRHKMLTKEQVLSAEPGLNQEGLTGAAQYYDCQVQYAERLALENALAARENGATVRTYFRLDRLAHQDQRVCGVEYTDVISGTTGKALAPIIINAAGPWVDEIVERGSARTGRLIGGTKGSHIIVNGFPGAPLAGLYVEARSDGRPFFIIPWNKLYLIGTTDIRYCGSLDALTADEHEISYLINEANHVIPGAQLSRASVLYSYAGVRPLPYAEGKQESSITRRHMIHDHFEDPGSPLDGLISVIGGKLTTYRSLSEQVVDRVFKKLGRMSPRCRTGEVPLPGAAGDAVSGFADESRSEPASGEATLDHLISVYGNRARRVLKVIHRQPELARQIDPHTGAIAAEIVFAFDEELARTLVDVLMRRTMIGMGSDLGRGSVDAVLEVCKAGLGWSEERIERERNDYLMDITRFNPPVS